MTHRDDINPLSARDHLAQLIGEVGVHLARYGPDVRALLERIRGHALGALGVEAGPGPVKCGECKATGIWECNCCGAHPCVVCNREANVKWFGGVRVGEPGAKKPPRATREEVRAWLDARAKAAAGPATDDAPVKERRA